MIGLSFRQSCWPCQAFFLGYLFMSTFGFTKQLFLIAQCWVDIDFIDQLSLIAQLVGCFQLVNAFAIFLSGLSAPQTASGLR